MVVAQVARRRLSADDRRRQGTSRGKPLICVGLEAA